MKHTTKTYLLSIALLFSASCSVADTQLSVKHAWIAEAPPVSRVLAAYMNIKNNTDKTIVVKSISSEDFSSIEFHRTVYENDVASMQHLTVLTIPAFDTFSLKQGDYHLMLFNPVRKLHAGDTSTFTITTADNQHFDVLVPVEKSNASH